MRFSRSVVGAFLFALAIPLDMHGQTDTARADSTRHRLSQSRVRRAVEPRRNAGGRQEGFVSVGVTIAIRTDWLYVPAKIFNF